MDDGFDRLVELLNSAPNEQCVVLADFLENLSIDAGQLAEASNRAIRLVPEIIEDTERKMAFRTKVYVFAPREV